MLMEIVYKCYDNYLFANLFIYLEKLNDNKCTTKIKNRFKFVEIVYRRNIHKKLFKNCTIEGCHGIDSHVSATFFKTKLENY